MADKKEVKHHEYEKLDHKTLDDVLKHIEETQFPEIENAFKDFDNFKKDAHQHKLQVEIFKPSFDEFYTTVDKELGKYFKGGTDSIHQKEKEVKVSLAKGMMAYLKKARPELHKALSKNKFVKAMMDKGDNFKEAYETIAHYMDTYITGHDARRRGEPGMYSGLAQAVTDNKESTVNSLKSHLENMRGATHGRAWSYLVGQKRNASVGRFEPFKIAHYIKEKVITDKAGYKINEDDEHKFLMHDFGDLMNVYEGVKTGKWGADEHGQPINPATTYYVTPVLKEEKKKEKK